MIDSFPLSSPRSIWGYFRERLSGKSLRPFLGKRVRRCIRTTLLPILGAQVVIQLACCALASTSWLPSSVLKPALSSHHGAAWAQDLMPNLPTEEIISIRLGERTDGSIRIVFDLSGPAPYRVFMLGSPDRMVIDFGGTDFSSGLEVGSYPKDIIDTIRFGAFRPGISRIVLELKQPSGLLRHFRLGSSGAASDRAVIDFIPKSAIASGSRPATPDTDGSPGEITDSRAESNDWIAFAFLAEEFRVKPEVRPKSQRATRTKHLIVLDPGHGGIDPGASTKNGTVEKKVVLQATRVIRKILEATNRYEVLLTRDSDVFVGLGERFHFAETHQADVFISVHADSHPTNKKLQGSTVYVLSERASDEAAAKLAQNENKSDLIAGADLSVYSDEISSILIDLAQTGTMTASRQMAEIAHSALAERDRNIPGGVRSAGFAVLKSASVPSMLLELGYLSNRKEEALLQQDAYVTRIAERLLNALDSWFQRRGT